MQPTPPQLPPMRPSTPPMADRTPATAPAAPAVGGTKRLRQIVGYTATGSLGLVAAVLALQGVAKPGLRPTDLMATIEAQTELGIFNQKMGAAAGEVLMTEDQYRAKLAEAERGGEAKAELAFQKELMGVQADKERVVAAYQTLYQRANMIAQAALQLESMAQQFRQRLLEMTNGGRSVIIMVKDFACGLGDADACASARQDRQMMISESDELSRGDVGAKVRALMADIDDPATFIARDDQRRNGTPALDR